MIYLSRLPDNDIAADIFSIERDNPGIFFPEDFQRLHGDSLAGRVRPNRTYYYLTVPPTYDVAGVARTIGHTLKDNHGLSVTVIDEDRGTDDKLRVAKI